MIIVVHDIWREMGSDAASNAGPDLAMCGPTRGRDSAKVLDFEGEKERESTKLKRK